MNELNESNELNENNEDKNNKKCILDPFSVIIKLFILSKKKIGSKLCVYNNILYIQDIGIFQSVVRYYFQNTKVDIQYLYNPLEIASSHFLNEKYTKEYPELKNLFINSIKGLENLIGTYDNYTFIIHSLYLYINIISNHIYNDKYNERLFIRDNISNIYTNDIKNMLNSIWTKDKIKIILNMIDYIDKSNNSNESIKFLEEFMLSIDKEVQTIFNKNIFFTNEELDN